MRMPARGGPGLLRRLSARRVLLGLIAAVLVLVPRLARPQEREIVLEKILNPLPDFDPFEAPAAAAPRYFPDEVDRRARELMIDALTNRTESLQEHLRFLEKEDARLQREQGSVTGLAEHALDLVNNTIADREAFLAAQKQALKSARSPERKRYLEAILNRDDLTRADDLVRQSSTNQWGGILNRLISSIDLVGVASGNYAGAAAETLISQIYAISNREMSVEERRALARHLDHLKRYPDDPRNPEILEQAAGIEIKKKSLLVQKQLARGDEALAKGDLDRALFHFEIASFIDPESGPARRAVHRATELRSSRRAAAEKGLAAAPERDLSPAQETDARRLLTALSLRDPLQLEREAVALEKKHRGSALGDAALDAEAVALEMRGRHDTAKKILEELSRSAHDPRARERAAALLGSSEYNLLAAFHDARSERRAESVKYVLLGDDLLKKNLLYAAGAFAAAGPAAGVALGAVNAFMMGTNLARVLGDNPVSSQPVIDAGVAFVRSHPESESSADVYRVLAEAYEERGAYDKALYFHELAGSPREKLDAVKQKAARALLDVAARARSRDAREYYLAAVIDAYPNSAAAAEATRKLAEMARDNRQGLRMSKQFLLENPEIYGPRGLGLKASLLDGNPANMEIADRGVNLLNEQELLVYYQTPWGVRSQSYPVGRQTVERLFATLREKNQQVALADANRRAPGTEGGIQNLPSSVRRGTTGVRRERPEENEDTTFSFVRRADGTLPAYPKVLDHELLSENERNPESKYKLPPIQGSVSASRFTLSGGLPAGLWGNQIAIGSDSRSPFAGVQLPLPLLQGFVPVDFMIQGRPGGVSIYPRIHTQDDRNEDAELYR
ncbi:MAG TPA: hypothetical protein VNN77_08225 [candidate division Zixibacteria bacterium]|nr:hypothetical protein [candidate division Zixibacteria bacterium]